MKRIWTKYEWKKLKNYFKKLEGQSWKLKRIEKIRGEKVVGTTLKVRWPHTLHKN
jgi:hypothetical protein